MKLLLLTLKQIKFCKILNFIQEMSIKIKFLIGLRKMIPL